MSNPQWHWDSTRQLHYWHSPEENAYYFSDGSRVAGGGTSATTPGQNTSGGASGSPSSPRQSRRDQSVLPATRPHAPEGDDEDGEDYEDDEEEESQTQQYQTSTTKASQAALAGQMARLGIGTTPSNVDPSYTAQAFNAQLTYANTVSRVGNEPVAQEHDEILAKLRVEMGGRIRGTATTQNHLLPGYSVRTPSHRFFKRGRVIKVLWPEMYGSSGQSDATTENIYLGEGIYTKIRWFIIVREGHQHCNCLPINTYGKQGVSKRGILKSQHAIAFSTKDEPRMHSKEVPGQGELPMMPGIRVVPRQKIDKLDTWARIDFSRVYTVEHNVKVYDFGKVHEDYMSRLDSQWKLVIGVPVHGGVAAQPLAGVAEAAEDSEEEEEEEEDEEDDEDEQPEVKSKEGKKKASSKSHSKSHHSSSRKKEDKDDRSKKPRKKRGLFG